MQAVPYSTIFEILARGTAEALLIFLHDSILLPGHEAIEGFALHVDKNGYPATVFVENEIVTFNVNGTLKPSYFQFSEVVRRSGCSSHALDLFYRAHLNVSPEAAQNFLDTLLFDGAVETTRLITSKLLSLGANPNAFKFKSVEDPDGPLQSPLTEALLQCNGARAKELMAGLDDAALRQGLAPFHIAIPNETAVPYPIPFEMSFNLINAPKQKFSAEDIFLFLEALDDRLPDLGGLVRARLLKTYLDLEFCDEYDLRDDVIQNLLGKMDGNGVCRLIAYREWEIAQAIEKRFDWSLLFDSALNIHCIQVAKLFPELGKINSRARIYRVNGLPNLVGQKGFDTGRPFHADRFLQTVRWLEAQGHELTKLSIDHDWKKNTSLLHFVAQRGGSATIPMLKALLSIGMGPYHPDDNGALPGSFVPDAHLEEWNLNVHSFRARQCAMDLLRNIDANRFLSTTSPRHPKPLGNVSGFICIEDFA